MIIAHGDSYPQTTMTAHAFLNANVLLAWSAYFVGTASPGPSNLAIMSIASNQEGAQRWHSRRA
ncbi:hypothetical protein BURKHO8Y_10428 [Burkholderia sp. 8Y]|nr:hypothetical protein BURKHO8Y_10428 [Burkholderia sp. 8Y]